MSTSLTASLDAAAATWSEIWRRTLALPFDRATANHAHLAKFVGYFRGETKTWMDPSQPPQVTSGELHVQPLFGGRWLRLEHVGTVIGKPHAGEMLLGYNIDEAQHELCWVDSFHTGSAMMFCSGKARDDGAISVLGSYAAGPERWGWRTELRLASADSFIMTATNISPAGELWPALETLWTRT